MNHNAMSKASSISLLPLEELFAIVSAAASQDPNVMLAAGARLKECVKLPGTFNGLHQIASQRSVPLPVRQLAIIQCKNDISTQWRNRK